MKYRKIIFFVLFVIYFCRIMFLEQDLPPWGIGYYQPVDEGAYALMALNYENYGYINPLLDSETNYITPVQTRTNLIGNIITILSLEIFGDNYFGFRMGYIVVGAINYFLYIVILSKIFKNYKKDKWNTIVFYILCMLLLFDFMFYMSSRTVENSSIRLLFNQIIVLIWMQKPKEYFKRFFWLGLIATCSVFLVYITNIFVLLAIFICIIGIWLTGEKRGAVVALGSFCIGVISALVIASIYYKCVWDSNVIESTLDIISAFSGSEGYQISTVQQEHFWILVTQKLIAFWGSNSLLYNLPLVFIIIAFMPIIILRYSAKNDEVVQIIIAMIFSFMLQTMFVEDCIGRKIICIYPLIIALIFKLFLDRDYIKIYLEGIDGIKRLGYTYYLLAAICFCAYLVYYRFYKATDNTFLDFDRTTKWTIVLLGSSVVFLLFLYFSILVNDMKLIKKIKVEQITIFSVLCLIILNTSFIFRFSIINPTYYEKNAMIELREYISDDDVYVAGGGYQLIYSLYNPMQFLVADDISDIRTWMENNENVLLIDYEWDEGMEAYFNDYMFDGSEYTVRPLYIIERNYQVYGQKRNFCLYERTLKSNVEE